MAQGTVDKRFLTSSARRASAGVILALALAAFLLAGCGGGSSDTSGSTAATVAEAGSASGSSKGGPGEAGSGSDGASTGNGGGASAADGPTAQAAPGQAASSGSSQAGGKHGPSVPMPKGEPEPGITPQQRREATVASISLESPSVAPSSGAPQVLPARYTCDGTSTSPALRWQGVPQGTAELVLFAMNLRPVEGTLFFNWAVGGLSPDLAEIKAGQLPKGAVVGRNSFGKTGYELCPEGSSETYMFTLFAVPRKLSPKQGFDPLVLRKEVTDTSGNVGLLALSYARG